MLNCHKLEEQLLKPDMGVCLLMLFELVWLGDTNRDNVTHVTALQSLLPLPPPK
jgi:hypothetical protein